MKIAKKYLVQKFELDLLDPKTRKSRKRLGELLADDFFEFNQGGGISTKQTIVEGLPNCPEEEITVRSYEEKKLSSTIVLVHYIADRKILKSGKKRCTLCSSIWQKKSNKWKMVFFQGTPCK